MVKSNTPIKAQPVTDEFGLKFTAYKRNIFPVNPSLRLKSNFQVERGEVCLCRLQRLKNTAKYTRVDISSTIFFLVLSIFQDEKDSIDDKKFEYKTEKELNTFGTIVTISQLELEKYTAHCHSAGPWANSIRIQLFRKRLSEKMCTRQSRKVTL